MNPTMFLKSNLITIFLVIIFMNNSALSLKCHVCNSVTPGQEDCFTVEPKDTKYLQTCQGSMNNTCRTQEQWIEFEVLKQVPDKRVIRQCASTEFDANRACYYRTGFGAKTSVCNCLGDGCNSAGRTASVLFVTIGALLLLKMFH